MNQLKETLKAKENETERKIDAKDGIVFDRDALMDKEQRLAECGKNRAEQEEANAETASKLADKTES